MATKTQSRRTVLAVAAAGTLAHVLGCGDSETTSNPTTTSGSGGSGGTPGTGGSGATGGSPTTGGAGGTGGTGDACTNGAASTAIGNNHNSPHPVVMVPAQDVATGTDQTYTIALGGGMGGHSHEITVTSADFDTLKGGNTVDLTSTIGGNNNHTHIVTVACA